MAAQSSPLDSGNGLKPHNVTVDRLSYRGQNAVRVRSLPSIDAVYDAQKSGTGGGIVLLEGSSFHDGTIEVNVATNTSGQCTGTGARLCWNCVPRAT
jgi:hypothetical protein